MKKQNVTNKLAFNKAIVSELNDSQLEDVNGGTTPICITISISIVLTIKGCDQEAQ